MKETNPQPLKGTVKYDETWHGGRCKGMGKGYVGNKTTIMDAIEGTVLIKGTPYFANPNWYDG
jgi:hypothetical protein